MDAFELQLINPSSYRREGLFVTPWRPIHRKTGLSPEALSLHDEKGTPLTFQVDVVDPADPSRDVLVVRQPRPAPEGSDDYSTNSAVVKLSAGADGARATAGELTLEAVPGTGDAVRAVHLTNSKLGIHFRLHPEPDDGAADPHRRCYAGAATSVVFRDGEIVRRSREAGAVAWDCSEFEALELMRGALSWKGHYPEKRCMQIDQIQLLHDPSHRAIWDTHPLFDSAYELVASGVGPLRSFVTIASSPFAYETLDPRTAEARTLQCRLYRVLSLCAGADWVAEELFVKGIPDGGSAREGEVVNPAFRVRYFACMDFGHDPRIFSFRGIPDWFALSFATERPMLGGCHVTPDLPFGYGFATDVHAGPVANPHPGFPDADRRHRTFSWELYPSTHATCLHLFMHDGRRWFDDRIGRAWYEQLYRPLVARLTGGQR